MNKLNSPLLSQINKWLIRGFFLFFATFIFLDYTNRSPYYVEAVKHFAHYDLLITLMLVVIGLCYLFFKPAISLNKVRLRNISGWKIYVIATVITLVTFSFYGFENDLFREGYPGGIFHFSSLLIGSQLGLFFIVAVLAGIGIKCLKLLNIKLNASSEIIVGIGLGFSIITLLLFCLGAFALLKFEIVWPLFLVMGGIAWKDLFNFCRKTLLTASKPVSLHPLHLLAAFVLLLVITLNLTGMIRSMPVGFDALNLYMNTPNLIYEYQALTQGGQAYNWSLVMSLGFIMFDDTAMALLLSTLPGVLSVALLFLFARKFMSHGWSLVVCTLFYVTPVVIWQSVQEAKVDLGLLFILLVISLLFIELLMNKKLPQEADGEQPALKKLLSVKHISWQGFLILGWLSGFAFGIKYTMLFMLFALVSMIFYHTNKQWGFWATLLFFFAVVFGLRLYEFSSIEIDPSQVKPIMYIALLASLPFLIISFRQNKWGLVDGLKMTILFGVGFLLNFFPWMAKHYNENKTLSINALFTGKSPLPEADFSYMGFLNDQGEEPLTASGRLLADNSEGYSFLPEKVSSPKWAKHENREAFNLLAQKEDFELFRNIQHNEVKKDKGIYEEISRFMGYEAGVLRFTTVPYDVTMKTNVHIYAADIGFLLLLLVPLFMFVLKPEQLPFNLLKMLLVTVALATAIFSVYISDMDVALTSISKTMITDIKPGTEVIPWLYELLIKVIVWIGSAFIFLYSAMHQTGIMVTYLIVFVVCALFYFLFRHSLKQISPSLKILTGLLFIYFIFWILLASAISWYGILGLALGPLVIFAFIEKKESLFQMDRFIRIGSFAFVGIWIMMSAMLRLTHTNPIDAPIQKYYMPEFAEYQAGNWTAKEAREKLIGAYLPAIYEMNKDKTARIIRVATFINYFIESNDKRVYIDNQLNILGSLIEQSSDRREVIERLRNAEIKYILLALNVGANDITPEQSVKAKAIKLMEFIYNNPDLRLITTDRIVYARDSDMLMTVNGETVPVKYDVFGERIISPGLFAAYEIRYPNHPNY